MLGEGGPGASPLLPPLEPTALSWAVASGEVVLSDIPHRGGRTAVCVYTCMYMCLQYVCTYTQ